MKNYKGKRNVELTDSQKKFFRDCRNADKPSLMDYNLVLDYIATH